MTELLVILVVIGEPEVIPKLSSNHIIALLFVCLVVLLATAPLGGSSAQKLLSTLPSVIPVGQALVKSAPPAPLGKSRIDRGEPQSGSKKGEYLQAQFSRYGECINNCWATQNRCDSNCEDQDVYGSCRVGCKTGGEACRRRCEALRTD